MVDMFKMLDLLLNNPKKTSQLPTDVFDDLYLLLFFSDNIRPNHRKSAKHRVREYFLREKEKEMCHAYYTKHKVIPDKQTVSEMVDYYECYLICRKCT